MEIANKIKRTSYLAELECKLCIALNSKVYQTYEGSPLFNLILDYMEIFYDKADVVADLTVYMRLLQSEDCFALREKVKSKIDAMEAGHSILHHKNQSQG